MTTLREHLEAIRDRHHEFVDDSAWHRTLVWCHACDEVKFPCPDREDAAAALALIDAAERRWAWEWDTHVRLIRDPEAT